MPERLSGTSPDTDRPRLRHSGSIASHSDATPANSTRTPIQSPWKGQQPHVRAHTPSHRSLRPPCSSSTLPYPFVTPRPQLLELPRPAAPCIALVYETQLHSACEMPESHVGFRTILHIFRKMGLNVRTVFR